MAVFAVKKESPNGLSWLESADMRGKRTELCEEINISTNAGGGTRLIFVRSPSFPAAWITQRQRQPSDWVLAGAPCSQAVDSCDRLAACTAAAMSHLHAVVQAVVSNQSQPHNAAYPGGPSSQQSMDSARRRQQRLRLDRIVLRQSCVQQLWPAAALPVRRSISSRQSLGVNHGDSSGSASTRCVV